MIVSGPERVLGDGADVALPGPGECSGEIALLPPGPRRATVQAEGPRELFGLALLGLEREACLLAVIGVRARPQPPPRAASSA